jgi:hypothetical protein
MKVLTFICTIFICFTVNSQVKLDKRVQFITESNTQLEIDSVHMMNGRKVTFTKTPGAIDFPDFQPSCKGGDGELKRLIIDNFNISTKPLLKAIKKSGAQILQIQFNIDTDGTIINLQVINGISSDIDAEIVRILKLSEWTSGEHMGKKVNSSCNFNITFSKT